MVKLEVGQIWRTRNKGNVIILRTDGSHNRYPSEWSVEVAFIDDRSTTTTLTKEGKYFSQRIITESNYDLVELLRPAKQRKTA
jgi:hypothetical protein